ncbi:MAG: trypsin-like peptidase domain-containing protein [Verrucomicrobia bacterium]|nr:trypsin-like peptidase domain-containing protein [Verrucomicrobiota bacterium]
MKTNIRTARKASGYGIRLAIVLAFLAGFPWTQAKDVPTALDFAQQLNEAFVQVADSVSPAVVVIEVAQTRDVRRLHQGNPLWESLPPDVRQQIEEEWEKREKRRKETAPDAEPDFNGSGSGIVIRGDGYILTNTHVVQDAEKIRVRFKDGREFETVGSWTDPQSDIAVIKIDAKDLVIAKLGDSAKTRVGEFAIAIGAPFVLDYSVTFGHVSAKGRQQVIPSFGQNSLGAKMDQDFIQTDASINPGNSGGPLVNIRGEVIGVNTMVSGIGTGIGFAVPINRAKNIAEQLISDGKVARAWLGIGTGALRELKPRKIVKGLSHGLVVTQIQTNGPAFKSELKENDIITSVEGQPVTNVQELRDAIRAKKIGSSILLDVVRLDPSGGSETLKIEVRTEAWPEEAPALAKRSEPSESDRTPPFGLTVQTLTDELAKKYGVKKAKGVVVTDVQPESPAALVRLKPGDIITQVGQKRVRTPQEFREAVEAAGSKEVGIDFISDGVPESRTIKPRSH